MKPANLLIIFVSVLFLAFMAPSAYAQSKQEREYVGKPEARREAGMFFWFLVDPAGEDIEFLGAPYEFDEKNKRVATCIEEAIANEKQIRITGVWEKDGEIMSLDITSATCSPINSARDCPERNLGMRNIVGIYDGTECGDSCYIFLKLPNNKSFSAFAEEEVVDRLFGQEKGQIVSIDY